jgi:hypothetical protein
VFEYLQWYEYKWYCQPALHGVQLPVVLNCELRSYGFTRGWRLSFYLENSWLGWVQVIVPQEPQVPGIWTGAILTVDAREPVVREVSFNGSLYLPELDPRVPVCGIASNGARWIMAHESRPVGLMEFLRLFRSVSF